MNDSDTTQQPSDEAVWGEVPAVREPVYRIDERPDSWWETVLYGWQQNAGSCASHSSPRA